MAPTVVFAIPGDPDALTGGYIYDKRVMAELNALGWQVELLRLGDGFPEPTLEVMASALAALAAVPADKALVVDGLAFGALAPEGVAMIAAPLVALTHHPLALESGIDPDRAATLRTIERANLARAGHVAVTSPHTATVLIDDYGVPAPKLTSALPGVDRPSAASARPPGPPRILAVGSLVHRKGHDVLLAALDGARDLDWRADIAGAARDPAVAAALERQRTDLALEDRVRFAGEIDQAELEGLYREASLFALASRYEGYGMVFAEAIAWGLPIVACAAGAVPETVPKSAGLLVPPDDPAAFAAALRRLLTDADAYAACRAGALAAAAELPTWRDAGLAFDQTLRRVMAEARP